MKEIFKKGRYEFLLKMKMFLKLTGILLAVDIFLIIIWLNLPERIHQTVTKLATSAGLWIQNQHVLEKMHFFTFNSVRIILLLMLAAFLFSVIGMLLVLITSAFLEFVRKEKRHELSRRLMLSELVISFVITCFIMTRELPMVIVDTFMRLLHL